jgi:phage gp16-like protein
MLNNTAIKLVHTAKSILNLDDDTYRDILKTRYNKQSSKTLTYAEYQDLIKLFKQMGFKFKSKRVTTAGGTDRQVKETKRLVALHNVEAKRLVGIIKHVTGIDATTDDPLKWLGAKDLSKLIQALRRWKW